MPVYLLFILAPIDSQLSSIRYIFFLEQKSLNFFNSTGLPKILTATINFVLFVTAFIISSALQFKVSISISTNLILRPYCCKGWYVVLQARAGTIASSPLCSGLIFLKNNAAIAKRFADDPELTIIPYLAPKKLANFFSNSFTYFPL